MCDLLEYYALANKACFVVEKMLKFHHWDGDSKWCHILEAESEGVGP